MTRLEESLNWDELVIPFQLDGADVRGRIARLDRLLAEVLEQHDYPDQVCELIAEAATLTALIGQTVKLRWKLSLQIRGDGPIRMIATDYYGPTDEGAPARIRAYASIDREGLAVSTATPFENIGKGMFAVLIDQGPDMTPYQGITPLAGGSLSKCAETYFAQSEQLPTRFHVILGQSTHDKSGPHWRAGGIMLQHMPKASPLAEEATGEGGLLQAQDLLHGDDGENWSRVNILLDSVEVTEMIGPHVTPPVLLHRLFHEETPRLFDAQPVRFGCNCSAEKVRNTMSIYSAKDIAKMTAENGMVTADCQFCGAHYELEPTSLGFDADQD